MAAIQGSEQHDAIKAYAEQLPPLLEQKHGKSRTYSGQQIRKTVGDAGLTDVFICYAFVMFMDPLPFVELHRRLGESCDYAGMRGEVADCCFAGNADFTTDDLFSYTPDGGSLVDGVLDFFLD